jgi:hypothetical protein
VGARRAVQAYECKEGAALEPLPSNITAGSPRRASCTKLSARTSSRSLDWASLLQRVFRENVDSLPSSTRREAASRRCQSRVLQCTCGGRRKVTAFS